jgi:hypothetical protein
LEKASYYSSKPRCFKFILCEAELGCAWLSPPHVSSVKTDLTLLSSLSGFKLNRETKRSVQSFRTIVLYIPLKDDSEIISRLGTGRSVGAYFCLREVTTIVKSHCRFQYFRPSLPTSLSSVS